MHPKRLSIFGLGLLGASLGRAVKQSLSGCRVVGYAHRPATLAAALAQGAIDEGYDRVADAVRGADLIVLCTPVGLLTRHLDDVVPHLAENAVVTDVGSTKATLVRHAERAHPAVQFVGSHPMAGSEKRGVEHASADLYKGAVCILTPTERTNLDACSKVESFWQALEMRTRRVDPETHDRLICDVSHLPHAVAAALVGVPPVDALSLVGKGFLDTTRVAGGDGGLWRDILIDNRANLVDALRRLRGRLDDLESLLNPERAEELRVWLDRAAERRREAGERKG